MESYHNVFQKFFVFLFNRLINNNYINLPQTKGNHIYDNSDLKSL